MSKDNDDAIVASLVLLLEGRDLENAKALVTRALRPHSKHVKWVCAECGSDDLMYNVTAQWHADIQDWYVTDFPDGRCWCKACQDEVTDKEVHVDWGPEEESEENVD